VSTYYLDNQIASEEQKKQLLDFTYDPAGRTLETASENKETKAKSNVISHYAGSGNALTWTCEEEDKKECAEGKGKWSRSIPGIDGDLDAVQTSGGSITLQIHDLEGNVVGTVEDSETVTKLASTYNSTEFGVPQPGTTPPKYAWLGASGISTETSLGSGVATQGGASYIPQVARALQTAPVTPPGAFPNGSPGTQFTATPGAWTPGDQAEANHATEEAQAERQKTKETEAAEAFLAAKAAASDPSRYWRAWEAKKVGGELTQLLAIHDLAGQLDSLFGSYLAGDILKDLVIWELTGAKVEDWIEDFSESSHSAPVNFTTITTRTVGAGRNTKTSCGKVIPCPNSSTIRGPHGVNT
jgi:hypothetical protein